MNKSCKVRLPWELHLTSLKSPTLGMWFFLLLPRTAPELEMTTAVFHRVPPCVSSRSRTGDITTILYFFASYTNEHISCIIQKPAVYSHFVHKGLKKSFHLVHYSESYQGLMLNLHCHAHITTVSSANMDTSQRAFPLNPSTRNARYQ